MILNPREPAPNPNDRFVCRSEGSGRVFEYEFLDYGRTWETGTASGPRVIMVLFEEFKRGRLSFDAMRAGEQAKRRRS